MQNEFRQNQLTILVVLKMCVTNMRWKLLEKKEKLKIFRVVKFKLSKLRHW